MADYFSLSESMEEWNDVTLPIPFLAPPRHRRIFVPDSMSLTSLVCWIPIPATYPNPPISVGPGRWCDPELRTGVIRSTHISPFLRDLNFASFFHLSYGQQLAISSRDHRTTDRFGYRYHTRVCPFGKRNQDIGASDVLRFLSIIV